MSESRLTERGTGDVTLYRQTVAPIISRGSDVMVAVVLATEDGTHALAHLRPMAPHASPGEPPSLPVEAERIAT